MDKILFITIVIYAIIAAGYVIVAGFPKDAMIGYSILTGGFLLLLMPILAIVRENQSALWPFVKEFFASSWPVVSVMVILGLLLALNIVYNKMIRRGDVTSEYTTFNHISLILLAIQLVLIYKEMATLKKKDAIPKVFAAAAGVGAAASTTGKILTAMAENTKWIIWLIAVIQLMVVWIMQINLAYFTTEGLTERNKKQRKPKAFRDNRIQPSTIFNLAEHYINERDQFSNGSEFK